MATTRDMHADVMRVLERMNTKIDGLATSVENIRDELHRLAPRKIVIPIPRPRQGTQMARGASVTHLRQYTKDKNAEAKDGEQLYEEFSDDIEDKQYNTDALNCLEWIIALHIGSDLGILTWEQISKQKPDKMGLIIHDAINGPELKVFAQAAGQWAIQMLITNKMNSRIRYNNDRNNTDINAQEVVSLAPMTVPDIQEEYVEVDDQGYEWSREEEIFDNAIGTYGIAAHPTRNGVHASMTNIPGPRTASVRTTNVLRNIQAIPVQVHDEFRTRSSPRVVTRGRGRGGLIHSTPTQNPQYSVPQGHGVDGTSIRGGRISRSSRGRVRGGGGNFRRAMRR